MNTLNGTTEIIDTSIPKDQMGNYCSHLTESTIKTILSFLSKKDTVEENPKISTSQLGIQASFTKKSPLRITLTEDLNIITSTIKDSINTTESSIGFELDTFVNANKSHTIVEKYIKYDFCLDTEGLPKLTIYILFEKLPLRNATSNNGLIYNNYSLNFQYPIDPFSNDSINFKDFNSIEVFLIQEDPRTSRGTVTTVSQPTFKDK